MACVTPAGPQKETSADTSSELLVQQLSILQIVQLHSS